MKWRARARRLAREAALKLLFPYVDVEDPKVETLFITVPLPRDLMENCPPPVRAALCDLAADRAARAASQAVRQRVGSSVPLGRATLGVS